MKKTRKNLSELELESKTVVVDFTEQKRDIVVLAECKYCYGFNNGVCHGSDDSCSAQLQDATDVMECLFGTGGLVLWFKNEIEISPIPVKTRFGAPRTIQTILDSTEEYYADMKKDIKSFMKEEKVTLEKLKKECSFKKDLAY